MTERDELICYISDAYKDLNGFRPRFYNWNSMSIEELRAEADRLSADIGSKIEGEEAHTAEVKAAMDDPDAIVVLDPYWDETEDDAYYLEQANQYGDYSMYSVYRPNPAPANTALADALITALKR